MQNPRQPLVNTRHQPNTRNPQPSIQKLRLLHPKPSTHNPQPTTHNPKPSTLNPQLEAAVGALKAWVQGLGLVKGLLHGMDKDGQPIDMSEFGAVYIKYNSAGGELSEPGDAMLNGYAGDFRCETLNPKFQILNP